MESQPYVHICNRLVISHRNHDPHLVQKSYKQAFQRASKRLNVQTKSCKQAFQRASKRLNVQTKACKQPFQSASKRWYVQTLHFVYIDVYQSWFWA